MKRSTKMMLMSNGKRGQDENRAYNARENYGMEDKFRDRRGREHYNNGRFSPRGEYDGEMEERYYDGRGREHYDNGRFSPMRNEGGYRDTRTQERSGYGSYTPMHDVYRDETDMFYYGYPHISPIYNSKDPRYDRREKEAMRPMNKIGFSVSGEGEMEKSVPHEFSHDFTRDEMSSRRGGERMSGYGASDGYIPFTHQMGEEWTSHMKNEDGTHGAHWTMEQAEQVMSQRGIECDPMQFWVAINMIYSDYVKAAKAHNVGNKIEFYADMAKAFLDDKDAQPDKLARYYEYIVKH